MGKNNLISPTQSKSESQMTLQLSAISKQVNRTENNMKRIEKYKNVSLANY